MHDRFLGLIVLVCLFSSGSSALQVPSAQGHGDILGTVVDPTGAGIPGVRITVIDDFSKRTIDITTDCSGFYRLSNFAAGKYILRFGSKGFRTETRTVLVNPSQQTPLDLKMQVGQFVDWDPTIEASSGPSRFASIKGAVTDGNRGAIPGAHVLAVEAVTGNLAEATTNANGLYSVSTADRGVYTLIVEAQGFKTEIKRSVPVEAETSVDFQLSVAEYSGPMVSAYPLEETGFTGTIQGRVIDAAGAVPARITAVSQVTGRRLETATDSNGAYRLRGLSAGTYCAKFEAWAVQPEELRPTFQTSKEVVVQPARVAELNVSLPIPQTEIVQVCTASCVIQAAAGKSGSHVTLQLYAPSNVVRAGSELWITTALTNISRHAVSIRAQAGPTSTVDYQICADGGCGCPRHL